MCSALTATLHVLIHLPLVPFPIVVHLLCELGSRTYCQLAARSNLHGLHVRCKTQIKVGNLLFQSDSFPQHGHMKMIRHLRGRRLRNREGLDQQNLRLVLPEVVHLIVEPHRLGGRWSPAQLGNHQGEKDQKHSPPRSHRPEPS